MKISTRYISGFLCISIFLLPGCRYRQWIDEAFYQGKKVENHAVAAQQYVRNLHIYDEFDTLAHFDALWLSDQVRSYYVCMYARKHCLTEERFKTALRRQLEENKHFISFYVLAAIPDHGLLGEKDSVWGICLRVNNDEEFRPKEIKIVELMPEYKLFFGPTWTVFKTAYLVKFDAYDDSGNKIITADTRSLELYFTSAKRTAMMRWYLTQEGTVICHSLKHPNILAYDLYYR